MTYDFMEIATELNKTIFNNEVSIKKIYAPACMEYASVPKEVDGEAKLFSPIYHVDTDDQIIFLNPKHIFSMDRPLLQATIRSAMAKMHCLQHGKYSHLI